MAKRAIKGGIGMNRVQFLLSVSLLACIALVQPTFPQNASAQAAPASNQPSKDSQELIEIVVTAERRVSTAQKTAAAVSVRSGEDMRTQGRYELKDILEDVPGVVGGAASSVSTSYGSGTDNPASGLTIRGVQSNGGAGGSVTSTAAAAAIYVDDVFSGIGGGYNIDRVEVLRGPQGTLYGRSATSGVVAIHTRDPDTTVFSAEGTAEDGNYDLHHYTGDVNLPLISNTLALRVSGNLAERDGYYTAQGDAHKNTDFRAKALWTPIDNFSALFGYAQEDNVTHTGGVSISQGNSPSDFIFTPTSVAPGKNDFHQYWANFNLNLGPVAITYIPAYRTWYENAVLYLRSTVFNGNQTVYTPTDSFLTQELRIRNTDNDSKLKWQAGFTYYDNSLTDVNNLFLLPTASYAFKSDSHKSTTAEGVFAEGTYSFSPDTRLTTGIRYDHTQILNTGDYTSVLGITQSLTGDQGLRHFNNFTYKVRLEHDLTPQNLLYGMISTGFSPGDVTLTQDATFKPVVQVLRAETLTAYEVGSKNRFYDNHLQVNGDVYFYDYGGYQTAGLNTSPDTPQTPTFNTISSPMKSYGIELEVEARPWANGTVSFNASYTNARYGGFGENAFLFSKSEVPGIAPFQGTLAYDHHIPIGSATLALHGDVRFFTAHDTSAITQAWAALGAEPYVHVASQAIGDINATLSLGLHYGITAYVRNIADTRFIPDGWAVAGVFPGPAPGAPPIVSEAGVNLSDPRTFGVILSVKY
jgi:iron complex outermembrane receptor protein